jgi:fluoroquinolone transport system ATP-binding protein
MIEVKDLSYSYPSSNSEVLKKLNFNIKQWEIFGFLGPSWSWKSTTQKILYKILGDFKGDVIVWDQKLNTIWKEYLHKIWVGFELPNHYLKLSWKENIKLFWSFYEKSKLIDIDELFEMVWLEKSMDMKVEEYSKGMKMRLNFIRAIMHAPDILFFDEPTSWLDPNNAHIIKNIILDLKAKWKTIFITTHDMSVADELCDRVSFLVDWEIKLTDTPKKLKKQYWEEKVIVELKDWSISQFDLKNIWNNTDFLKFIKKDEVQRINSKEATLEEVFIQVTGKTLKV